MSSTAAPAETLASRWRGAGVSVQVVALDRPPEEMSLRQAQFEVVALLGISPSLVTALHSTAAFAAPRVVVFAEGDEGLHSAALLDSAFHQPERTPFEFESVARLAADTRVHFVCRWPGQASLLGLGQAPNSLVGWPRPTRTEQSQVVPGRVALCGSLDDRWRSGVDLAIRTVAELGQKHDVELILSDLPFDESLLAPLRRTRAVVRRSADSDGAVILATQRDAAGVTGVAEALSRNQPVVATQHPALDAVLGRPFGVKPDPAALAAAVRAAWSGALPSPELVARVRGFSSAESLTEKEIELLRARPTRRPTEPQPLLSVIVPAFNAQATLGRTLASLVSALRSHHIEVLVINDGSTDATGTLAEQWATNNPGRVQVIHQTNRGHGGAINTGLREARGRWFRVVDADDWVESLALNQLVEALQHCDDDAVLTDYSEVYHATFKSIHLFDNLPAEASLRINSIVDSLYGFSSWGFLLATATFRTERLRQAGLTLTEQSAYVDLEYCAFALRHVETFRYLPLNLYRYSLGSDGQTVSDASYRARTAEHEAVIVRLATFARDTGLTLPKQRYLNERVLAPVVEKHLHILHNIKKSPHEVAAFLARMAAFPLVPLPQPQTLPTRAAHLVKSVLPPAVSEALSRLPERTPEAVVNVMKRYLLPSVLLRKR